MRLAGAAAAALLLTAGAARADDLLDRAIPCRGAADQATCLLKVSAEHDGGSAIWRDPDLSRAPAVLSALGLSAAGVAAARGANEAERTFFGAMDEGKAAVEETLARDRAGRDPAEALAPILELSMVSPTVPPFFMRGGELPSPRAEAYQALIASREALAQPPSAGLAAAAADAWERDLRDPTASPAFRASAYWLAPARLVLRDEAGVDRAVAMIPSPLQRIELLANLGRFDAAVRAALALRRDEVVATVRREMTVQAALIVRANAAAARAASQSLPELMRRSGLQDDPKVAREMEKMLRDQAKAERAPPPVPRISPAEVESEADNQIGQMQDHVLREALRKQRSEVARPLADRVLQEPDLPDNRYRFPLVLKAATPEAAVARLEALDAALSPTKGADRLEPLVQAWTQIGRPDRADQLVERAAGWARKGSDRRPSPYAEPVARQLWARGRQTEAAALARLAPDERLKLDIVAGRGLSGFDRYYAEADEGERNTLLVSCGPTATAARAWSVAVECAQRRSVLATAPHQRHAHAGMAVQQAAQAADADEVATARLLLDKGLEEGAAAVAVDPQTRTWPGPFSALNLLAVAKAELRAEGRLPRSSSPPQP